MQKIEPVPCVIMRGGTSRAVFVRSSDVPSEPDKRDDFIRKIMGSPDPRQIDGLGGADILTSKFAIIGPPTIEGADVDYTFAQVGIAESSVNYSINCGNISSAVAVYAVEEGFVPAKEPVTTVRIHNTNTGKILSARVPVKDGKPEVYGPFAIDGVPGTGAEIELNYAETAGAKTGKLLPTGNPVDTIMVPELGKALQVSVVDIANLCVFFDLHDVGLTGKEKPDDFTPEIMQRFRAIRRATALMLGLDPASYVPFTIGVQAPQTYESLMGKEIPEDQVDITGRMVGSTSFKPHMAFPGTGGVCLAVASAIPGTIPHQLSQGKAVAQQYLRIGHPSGIMTIKVKMDPQNAFQVKEVIFSRTARRIMEGTVYIKW